MPLLDDATNLFINGNSAISAYLNGNKIWELPQVVGAGPIDNGLLFHLDGTIYSSGQWIDQTGNGYNATINGATYSSVDGGTFDLDGINDSIQIAHNSDISLNSSTQKTIQVWVKFDALGSTSTTQVPVFGKLSSSYSFDGYWGGLYGNTGNVRVVTNGTAVQRVSTTTTNPVSINNWYLFTFISQISSATNSTKVYINTTEVLSNTHGTDGYNEANPLYLGYIGAGVSSTYLNGKIGACYFYNRGLSASEVTDNFNNTKARFGI
jgi:hypothetical protein